MLAAKHAHVLDFKTIFSFIWWEIFILFYFIFICAVGRCKIIWKTYMNHDFDSSYWIAESASLIKHKLSLNQIEILIF